MVKKKKSNKRKLIIILSLAAILIMMVLAFIFKRPIIYYSKIIYHKVVPPSDADHKLSRKETNLNGEIFVPRYDVYGIDISRHQGRIDWEKLSEFKFQYNSISFVYIKATESNSWQDKFFSTNWKMAKKYGFYRGAYHFFDPHETPEEQMNYFFSKVKLSIGDLPPMLDVEQESRISTANYQSMVLRCLQIMEKHYHMKPILYINQNFYDDYFSTEEFSKYPLWISRLKESKPSQENWIIWQFTHKAIVDGITEYVDLNAFNGSEMDFKVLLKD